MPSAFLPSHCCTSFASARSKAPLSSRRAATAPMDPRGTDADGAHASRSRRRRARKMAVVLALQNLLVVSCLVLSLYVYWNVHWNVHWDEREPTNVHISFQTIADVSMNGTLQLNIFSSFKMSVTGQKNDRIYINCTGPYLLYMEACYTNMEQQNETKGTLQLRVGSSETPLISFDMATSATVCRGHHGFAYFKAKDHASLHLYASNEFKVKNLTIGLSYLRGSQCVF